MTFLKAALEGSLLLRPWVRLAQLGPRDFACWVRHSRLGGWAQALGGKLAFGGNRFQRFRPAFNTLLWVGVALLFVLFCFAETGLIGAAVMALLALVLLGLVLFHPPLLPRLTVVDALVLAFLASAALSTAFSSYVATSVIGLAKMIVFVAGYIVFRTLSAQGERPVLALLGVLVVVGLGESLVGFYQHVNHIQPLATWSDASVNPELQMDRIFGTLKPSNPNLLAGFLIPCFAAAAGLLLRFVNRQTWPLSLALAGICLCMLVALVWTGSRGGFLAIAVMLATMFAYVGHLIWHEAALARSRWLKPLWLVILFGSLIMMAAGIVSSEKIRHRVESIFAMRQDSSISYRLNVYHSVTELIKDNPVVGIGPGNGTFKLVYGLYMVPGYNALGAYSVPLEITAEQGVIGLAIFLSLMLVLVLRTLLFFDRPVPVEQKLLVGALLMGILGSFTYGIFDTIWYRPAVNLLFWFMVAALATFTEPNPNVFKGNLDASP